MGEGAAAHRVLADSRTHTAAARPITGLAETLWHTSPLGGDRPLLSLRMLAAVALDSPSRSRRSMTRVSRTSKRKLADDQARRQAQLSRVASADRAALRRSAPPSGRIVRAELESVQVDNSRWPRSPHAALGKLVPPTRRLLCSRLDIGRGHAPHASNRGFNEVTGHLSTADTESDHGNAGTLPNLLREGSARE